MFPSRGWPDRAGDGEPLAPGRDRDGHPRDRLEGQRARATHREVEGRLVDVAAGHPGGAPAAGQGRRGGPRVGHVDVLLGRGRAPVHEVERLVPDLEGERRRGTRGARGAGPPASRRRPSWRPGSSPRRPASSRAASSWLPRTTSAPRARRAPSPRRAPRGGRRRSPPGRPGRRGSRPPPSGRAPRHAVSASRFEWMSARRAIFMRPVGGGRGPRYHRRNVIQRKRGRTNCARSVRGSIPFRVQPGRAVLLLAGAQIQRFRSPCRLAIGVRPARRVHGNPRRRCHTVREPQRRLRSPRPGRDAAPPTSSPLPSSRRW